MPRSRPRGCAWSRSLPAVSRAGRQRAAWRTRRASLGAGSTATRRIAGMADHPGPTGDPTPADHPEPAAQSAGIPVLGVLSPIARIAVLVTVALAVVAIVV